MFCKKSIIKFTPSSLFYKEVDTEYFTNDLHDYLKHIYYKLSYSFSELMFTFYSKLQRQKKEQ